MEVSKVHLLKLLALALLLMCGISYLLPCLLSGIGLASAETHGNEEPEVEKPKHLGAVSFSKYEKQAISICSAIDQDGRGDEFVAILQPLADAPREKVVLKSFSKLFVAACKKALLANELKRKAEKKKSSKAEPTPESTDEAGTTPTPTPAPTKIPLQLLPAPLLVDQVSTFTIKLSDEYIEDPRVRETMGTVFNALNGIAKGTKGADEYFSTLAEYLNAPWQRYLIQHPDAEKKKHEEDLPPVEELFE